MIGPRLRIAKNVRDEAEKPFWISYADLMTSLMVVFLVVMIVLLAAVAREIELTKQEQDKTKVEQAKTKEEQAKNLRLIKGGQAAVQDQRYQDEQQAKIKTFEEQLSAELRPLGATVDFENHRILLGDIAEFGNASSVLSSDDQEKVRAIVKKVLSVYRMHGRGLLTRVDVEGFASSTGDYFTNLDLSLRRSEVLMCTVLSGRTVVPGQLSRQDQEGTATLFAIGGRSSNDLKPTEAQSRRIELSLQFASSKQSDSGVIAAQPPSGKPAFDYLDPGQCRAG